uniref:RRM domain-containing protein n=1 Tax=Macrostomum lignano TaxID=282301 RepID=A0A1I8HCY6_9PLAT
MSSGNVAVGEGSASSNSKSSKTSSEQNNSAVQQPGSGRTATTCVLRMRGLPYDATPADVVAFFADCPLRGGESGVHLSRDKAGRPSGEGYAEFEQNMGHRYIELFPSSMAEAYAEGNRQRCMRQAYQHGGYGGYGDFYPPHQPGGPGQHPGFHPGRGGARGVGGLGARGGRGAGPGFGYGAGRGGHPGGRWQPQHHPPGGGYSYPPPPFPQHPQQRNFNYHPHGGVPGGGFHGQFYQQPHGYPRQFHRMPHQQHQQKNYRPGSNWQSSTGHWVHLRGLPFSVTVAEVTDFFAPLKPSRVQLHFNRAGRPNGEADVDFGSAQEAEEAMKRDKAHIGSRYIDLFLHPDKADAAKRQNGVRLRGLPDGVTEADIEQFFQPSVPARICLQAGGEAEAFFDSAEDQQRAITLSGEKIGERCINVFLR